MASITHTLTHTPCHAHTHTVTQKITVAYRNGHPQVKASVEYVRKVKIDGICLVRGPLWLGAAHGGGNEAVGGGVWKSVLECVCICLSVTRTRCCTHIPALLFLSNRHTHIHNLSPLQSSCLSHVTLALSLPNTHIHTAPSLTRGVTLAPSPPQRRRYLGGRPGRAATRGRPAR